MLRASAICENAGVSTVSLISEGFIGQARSTSSGLGLDNLPLAMIPGHPGVQSLDELEKNILAVTADAVLAGLLGTPEEVGHVDTYGARDIVFTGTLDEVNRVFIEKSWSDGLPVVPPTPDRVEEFLRFVDRDPDEVLGVLAPDNRQATIWSIAVNGVMAGCRPSYMPILVAIVEALCEPDYGVEHSGNTPGADTLIMLNGPIARQLGFNCEQGVLRDGFQPNTSVGRFLRLYQRNIAGFLLHGNDKGTFGNTWRVAMPENEEVLAEIGWPNIATDMGLPAGVNAVTISRYTGGDVILGVAGDTPPTMLPYIADSLVKLHRWQLVFTVGLADGMLRPLLLLTPILAKTMARKGWTKQMVKQFLFETARIPAFEFQRYLDRWSSNRTVDIRDEVRLRRAPDDFYLSDDPDRMVPIVYEPDDFMIAVTGDPLRTNAYAFAHNGTLGFPVCKQIRLPGNWDDLMKEDS